MDLAHRWAVDYIVVMLSGILQTLINDENFVAITEAAAYKGPDTLRSGWNLRKLSEIADAPNAIELSREALKP